MDPSDLHEHLHLVPEDHREGKRASELSRIHLSRLDNIAEWASADNRESEKRTPYTDGKGISLHELIIISGSSMITLLAILTYIVLHMY